MEEVLENIFNGILDGDREQVKRNVHDALSAKIPPAVILTDSMIAAMSEVGQRFEDGEYYVPEMLIAARAMKEGLEILKPYLKEADIKSPGRVAAGTVRGDLHDIGKNLVCMMLEGAGFEIVDLGTDVTPDKFVDAVQNRGANLIAMSALLTTTMPNMQTTIDALKTAGLREKVKVMIGGAPVTENYARQIGADGYAADASRAVALAKSLVA
jgi:5-methyltetrahydrofolate--homocysteine methyltransferase